VRPEAPSQHHPGARAITKSFASDGLDSYRVFTPTLVDVAFQAKGEGMTDSGQHDRVVAGPVERAVRAFIPAGTRLPTPTGRARRLWVICGDLGLRGGGLPHRDHLSSWLCAGERTSSLLPDVWSGAGSNRRPSAFQVNRAKRCADLRKRTSLTSGTALGGRCRIHASRVRHALFVRQAGRLLPPARRWREHLIPEIRTSQYP
jgi:hypothetical protein